MTLDNADKQTLRDLVENFRASRTAVARSENFGAPGGPGEQQYKSRQAVYEANAANLKHFLDEKAEEGVGDDELGKAATMTPMQLAELKRELI
jgi:hypothetical protein